MSKADFDEAMQVHFWAPYHATMAGLPHLKRNRESSQRRFQARVYKERRGLAVAQAVAPSLLTTLAAQATARFNEEPTLR